MAYGKAGDWYVNNVEGGGGSSDFSIVNVTIINHSDLYPFFNIPNCSDSETPLGLRGYTNIITPGRSATIKVPLYKGAAMFTSDFNITTSGSITYDEYYNVYIITGDCTITIS